MRWRHMAVLAIVATACGGCTFATSAGFAGAIPDDPEQRGGYAHIYTGIGGKTLHYTADVRGHISRQSGAIGLGGGLLSPWFPRSAVTPFSHIGIDSLDFGWVGNEFSFGMLSPWAELGVRFGRRRFFVIGAGIEYVVRFTHASSPVYMVFIGLGSYKPLRLR